MFLMAAGSGMGRDDDVSVARVYSRPSWRTNFYRSMVTAPTMEDANCKRSMPRPKQKGRFTMRIFDLGTFGARVQAYALRAARYLSTPVMTVLALILALPSMARADAVNVKDRGWVDLKPFVCEDYQHSRLVRRICRHCKTERAATAAESEWLGLGSGAKVFMGAPEG